MFSLREGFQNYPISIRGGYRLSVNSNPKALSLQISISKVSRIRLYTLYIYTGTIYSTFFIRYRIFISSYVFYEFICRVQVGHSKGFTSQVITGKSIDLETGIVYSRLGIFFSVLLSLLRTKQARKVDVQNKGRPVHQVRDYGLRSRQKPPPPLHSPLSIRQTKDD